MRRGCAASWSRLKARPARASLILILVAAFLVALPPATSSQYTNDGDRRSIEPTSLHQWGAVTLFHGLPSDRVRAIAQDRDGAMWFGTDAGLARYDGRRTQTITSDDLPEGRILALTIDDSDALWVGTEGGASRLVGNRFQLIRDSEGKAVTSIITPERGRAILTTDEGVVFDCATQADSVIAVRTIPKTSIKSADEEHPGPLKFTSAASVRGVVYAGSESRGLLALNDAALSEVQSRPRPFFVEALTTDKQSRLWIGTRVKGAEGALFSGSDVLKPALIASDTGPVMALAADSSGEMWVGTDGRGVFRYRDAERVEHFTFDGTAGGLRSDHVFSIFVDRENVVWFGTDRGVCRYDPSALRVDPISTNPESNFVRDLWRTRSGVLLAGTNRGLFEFDATSKVWKPFAELAQKTIYSIYENAAGRLFVGSASGLYESDSPTGGALHFTRSGTEASGSSGGESVRAVAEFKGAVYVATFGRGIERVEGAKRTVVWPTDPANGRAREVVSLYADKSERLWIGTATNGVYVFDGTQATIDPALNELSDSAVWYMDGTVDGWMWLATSRGLYGYWHGVLQHVLGDIDARRVMVNGPRANSRQAWCATAGNGLVKVSIDDRSGSISSRLDAEQGLPSQSAFALLEDTAERKGDSGTLLIGTSRGLARYRPGLSPPILTVTRIIGQRVHSIGELNEGLKLEYPQNSLVLDVAAASSRTFPEQFLYAFLLVNDKGELIKQKLSHDSQFSMEGLRSGGYRIEVRAYSADLVSSETLGFEFSVAKAPFPWSTAALSALLLLALFALIWAVIEHRRITHASAALALANHDLATARLRLANEAEAERSRIARDLHDQTLADLRRLLLLTDQLPEIKSTTGNGEAPGPAAFRSEIESVSKEIRRICEDLSPSVLENVGLTAALEWALTDAVAHAAEPSKFEYEFECAPGLEERIALAPGVRMQIYRIVQEAISNICRHAGAQRVRLKVKLTDEGDLILSLEDDGRGFDVKDKKSGRGRGLANIRARASLIEADVDWSRDQSGMTIFTLRKANVAGSPTPQPAKLSGKPVERNPGP